MDTPIASYLHDHLAGAAYAMDLADAIRDHYKESPLGAFAQELGNEIRADRRTLADIAKRFSPASSGIKEGAGWFGEKVSRFKLPHSDSTGLGTLEALEFLQLAIRGKLALWRTLAHCASIDPRLDGVDFEDLILRASVQDAAVEEQRLMAAKSAFCRASGVPVPSQTATRSGISRPAD
jgi:hypothetical protein